MYPYVSPGNSVLESTWRGNLPLDFLHGHIETFRFLFLKKSNSGLLTLGGHSLTPGKKKG